MPDQFAHGISSEPMQYSVETTVWGGHPLQSPIPGFAEGSNVSRQAVIGNFSWDTQDPSVFHPAEEIGESETETARTTPRPANHSSLYSSYVAPPSKLEDTSLDAIIQLLSNLSLNDDIHSHSDHTSTEQSISAGLTTPSISTSVVQSTLCIPEEQDLSVILQGSPLSDLSTTAEDSQSEVGLPQNPVEDSLSPLPALAVENAQSSWTAEDFQSEVGLPQSHAGQNHAGEVSTHLLPDLAVKPVEPSSTAEDSRCEVKPPQDHASGPSTPLPLELAVELAGPSSTAENPATEVRLTQNAPSYHLPSAPAIELQSPAAALDVEASDPEAPSEYNLNILLPLIMKQCLVLQLYHQVRRERLPIVTRCP